MANVEILNGKKILIVDDEPDILETLEEMLDMCQIDTAPNYETAKKFLEKEKYDLAILDIMGVRGYDLLKLAKEKEIPALMLTAHALNPDNLVKSIESGADSYVPKEKIAEIDIFAADVLAARTSGEKNMENWFRKLGPFFDEKFGKDWKESHKPFWKDFDKKFIATKDDVTRIL